MNNNALLYRGLCAPIHKRGTLREDLGRIFQCDDRQNTDTHQARFQRGAECLQRRIYEMSRHRANTPANKEKRKRHFIPLNMTYGFAKDCLQRYASDSEVRDFERNTNRQIKRLLGYPHYSIENTMRREKNLINPLRNSNNSAAADRPQSRHIFVSNSRRGHTRRRTRPNMNITFNTNNMMRTVSYRPYMSPKPE